MQILSHFVGHIMDSKTKNSEIKILAPWGHIAAKTWGEECSPAVLCFHGIMDNAGSFNRLIEYLPTKFYYISVDLPGHGLSSSFPPHLPLHSINNILVYKIVVEHFKRDQYIILAHSYGGKLGFMFAQLYPQYVEKLVLFDTLNLLPVSTKHFGDYLSQRFNMFLYLEDKLNNKVQPSYTYEEALERLMYGRNYEPLNEQAAKALLERSVESDNNGKYKFIIDQRLKNYINPLRDVRYIIESSKAYPVKCPILIILGKESMIQQKIMHPIIEMLKKWKNVTIKIVEGNHDVHNNYPERVAPFVVDFLSNIKSKL